MKFNKIRPLLLLAFVIGSLPLQSEDSIPETSFVSVTTTKAAPCSSGDHGDSDSDEDGKKATRTVVKTRTIASVCP